MEELPCIIALKKVRSVYGTSEFDRAVKTLMRERLKNPGREKRKRIPPRLKEKLYAKQGGKCANPKCDQHFRIDELEGDHIDCNRQDFNSPRNWQLLCKPCNSMKNAMTVEEWTKYTGQTTAQVLENVEEP